LSGKLVIFCGIPGSGKTTIARIVAQDLKQVFHIQTDVIRLMIPHPKYTAQESRLVYKTCIMLAREALRKGYDAILDGTFLKDEYRDEAITQLARYYSSYLIVYIVCNPETAYRRNEERKARVPKRSFLRLYETLEEPISALRIDATRTKPLDAARAVLLQLG